MSKNAFFQSGPWWPDFVHTTVSTEAMLLTLRRTLRMPVKCTHAKQRITEWLNEYNGHIIHINIVWGLLVHLRCLSPNSYFVDQVQYDKLIKDDEWKKMSTITRETGYLIGTAAFTSCFAAQQQFTAKGRFGVLTDCHQHMLNQRHPIF